MATELFSESVEYLRESLDRDTRTVKQIIIRAGMSKNKRNYPETVLKEAVSLFEGVKTYANHPDPKAKSGRDVRETTGWIAGVQFDEGIKALVGTRHFSRNSAGNDIWNIVEDVISGNAPSSLIGGSINALGNGRRADDGTLMVESITRAFSVDDVDTPAAGGGFEKLVASEGGIVEAVLSEATYEEWFEACPEHTKRLQKEMKAVRQTEAVKAATAEADQLRETVNTLQVDVTEATQARDAALAELAMVRRELQIEKMMRKAHLPEVVEKPLRERLAQADEAQWVDIIHEEKLRAKYDAAKVPVSGAGRRVSKPLPIPSPSYEGVMNWMEVDTPEKQRALMQRLAKKG
jgi:hypothetical protein